MRRLRLLVASVITVVLVLSVEEQPSPGLHGAGLLVAVALLALTVSTAALLRGLSGDRRRLAALAALTAASSGLVWIQHGGPGVAGLFVGVSYAAIALPIRRSLPVLALAVVELPILITHAHRSAGRITTIELAIIAFYVIATVARHAQEAHEQATALLGELETRDIALVVLADPRPRPPLPRLGHPTGRGLSGARLYSLRHSSPKVPEGP
jgi:hypothetical protein